VVEEAAEEPAEEEQEATSPTGADDGVGEGDNDSDSTDSGKSSGSGGEGDQGSSDRGDSDTNGNADSGNNGNDFEGDGLITRRVIKRYQQELMGMVEKNGLIVINLCVNRDGEVIEAYFNENESTLNSPHLAIKAVGSAYRYIYEKDPTAERKQCGQLRMRFSGIE